ncbi:hypothetical protein [Capnocytophaga cynodegmi]|uniref:Uncharacterized protein n=1 Tax=Capnocytophaga cynodegmi TaxID=28189 RepID=A0A0B7HDF1_9FLAO|nr:hypothetical protein [Capnocytophaga cynodegmi]CEN36659.1 hypothetical protein CCYN74_20011 [Capnocytophaga cynodegmi]
MEAKNPKGYLIHCLKNELGKNNEQEEINGVQQELDFNFDFLDSIISLDLTQEEAKTIVKQLLK